MRSSQQQLNEDLHRMYRELTDPEEIAKRKVIKNREKQAQEKQEDYGL